jgi:uncharacterized protein YyaL (SSP411 family)
MKEPNLLIHESSPYLLQHAYNPVQWYPWSEAAWEKAKKENKLVLISIGYSSCHWCHVMEHESFEDDSIAALMNEHFICIKVDREERPDVDQIYMTAVQLMTGSGGWPLNCFTLPDGRPIYGGTYYPKSNWNQVLKQLHDLYSKSPEKAEQYAEELIKGIRQAELVRYNDSSPDFNMLIPEKMVDEWKSMLDKREGGPNRAPKFPLPDNYEFLLHYATLTKDRELLDHVHLTLHKMAYGGIYDQAGGGFSRYSVDSLWKVPHFEKMLYDNAQMISLYSKAWQQSGDKLYKDVVFETLDFIFREMTSPEGGFYSALDADSEGEEGKFYVWEKNEIEELFKSMNEPGAVEILSDYYSINRDGYWENGNYILLRKFSDEEICKKHAIEQEHLKSMVAGSKRILLEKRSGRVRPGTDDKVLVSWNSMMIEGLCDAYQAFREEGFLMRAEKNAQLILTRMKRNDGGLYHTYKNGKARINGYLEDYAFFIQALISLYECTFDEKYIREAASLTEYVYKHFYDEEKGFFWFTSSLDPVLIARKKEIQDNVIPSSNSAMANALFLLGIYLEVERYAETARTMLHHVSPEMVRYGPSYSNWASLYLNISKPFYEIVISGTQADKKRKEIQSQYLPNALFAGSYGGSSMPLLLNRENSGKTLIYVCENKTCKLPVEDVASALRQMKNN